MSEYMQMKMENLPEQNYEDDRCRDAIYVAVGVDVNTAKGRYQLSFMNLLDVMYRENISPWVLLWIYVRSLI